MEKAATINDSYDLWVFQDTDTRDIPDNAVRPGDVLVFKKDGKPELENALAKAPSIETAVEYANLLTKTDLQDARYAILQEEFIKRFEGSEATLDKAITDFELERIEQAAVIETQRAEIVDLTNRIVLLQAEIAGYQPSNAASSLPHSRQTTVAMPSGDITIYHEFTPIRKLSRAKIWLARLSTMLKGISVIVLAAALFLLASIYNTMTANGIDVNRYIYDVLHSILQ